MDNTTVSMVFRIEKDLKTAFEQIARSRDETVSQMLRKYIRTEIEQYAKEHAQKDLFRTTTAPTIKNTPKSTPKDKKTIPEGKTALLDMFKRK